MKFLLSTVYAGAFVSVYIYMINLPYFLFFCVYLFFLRIFFEVPLFRDPFHGQKKSAVVLEQSAKPPKTLIGHCQLNSILNVSIAVV